MAAASRMVCEIQSSLSDIVFISELYADIYVSEYPLAYQIAKIRNYFEDFSDFTLRPDRIFA